VAASLGAASVFRLIDSSGEDAMKRIASIAPALGLAAALAAPAAWASVSGAICTTLLPYADTPNPGGEYKVWLTPLASYACDDLGIVDCPNGKHGFIPSESKTDNFKVNSVADEIDTRFLDFWGNYLDNRRITWFDTHGASNAKWSYYDPAHVIMHEAHVEAPEVGTQYIQITDQAGCKVGDVYVDGTKTRKKGPQTVAVRITKGMKSKGSFTIFVDVRCDSTQ
jgi:hypothetical protein